MHDIAKGKYGLIWGLLPPRNVVKPIRWLKLAQLIEAAYRHSVPAVMSGSFESSLWDAGELQSLRAQGIMKQSTHAWCHYGVSLWPDSGLGGSRSQPSARKHKILSTFVVPHCMCSHPQNVQHYFDKKRDHQRSQNMSDADRAITKQLLVNLIAFSGPSRVPESDHKSDLESDRDPVQTLSLIHI